MRKVMFGLMLVIACGGSATTGGTGGGGTGSGTPEQLIDQFCAKVASMTCSVPPPTEAQCRADLTETRADNVADGCVKEFDAVMGCAAAQQPTCSGVEAVCPTQVAALNECRAASASECSLFSGGSTGPACGVACPTYSAVCNSSPSGLLQCECLEGPRVGATFSVSSCATDVKSIADANCL